jgi:hypothetical protein
VQQPAAAERPAATPQDLQQQEVEKRQREKGRLREGPPKEVRKTNKEKKIHSEGGQQKEAQKRGRSAWSH